MSLPLALFLAAIALFAAGAALAALLGRSPRRAALAGGVPALAGCVAGMAGALLALGGGGGETFSRPWSLPFGSLALGLDPLSAFFLLPLFLLGALAVPFAAGYLPAHAHGRDLGLHWSLLNLLLASMALVPAARDGLLFLLAWETMALVSFFLITFDDERENVRFAGWVYLTATHLSGFCLLVLFLLLGQGAGSLSFSSLAAPASVPATALFLLALVGFGTKAGIFPLHLWLPEAHPAAPSHVSALLSGVMINTGFYGLLRSLTFLGAPPPAWGGTLLALGAVTAVMGALYALAQRDLKRVLAYSSVENMGIVAMGVGTGLLCSSLGQPGPAAVAWASALLHLLNHSAMKGLLFLGAGMVLHRAGTVGMEGLGGLLKRMPWTGAAFGVGSAAIASLPPGNGFAGEFLLALSLLMAGQTLYAGGALGAWGALAALGLTGGLAAAVFVRAFGVTFLGNPRSPAAAEAGEGGWLMRAPLLLLAALCALAGVLSPLVLTRLVAPALAALPGGAATGPVFDAALGPLTKVALASAALWALLLLLAGLRRRLLAGRPVETGPTWDCGYSRPTARMQYGASSFAEPLTSIFSPLLGTRRRVTVPRGLFPTHASFASETPDGPTRYLVAPVFAAAQWVSLRMRALQHGQTHLYVLAIVLTLVALLLWRMG